MSWALLTGEYPPQHGGVADYTRVLARALVAGGDVVHVFAPPCRDRDDPEEGITVHRLPDVFGPKSRAVLQPLLATLSSPRASIVQYVPQAFGMRGCNVPFAMWLGALRGYPLFVMFHEVSVTVLPDTPLKYRLQALATRIMASRVIEAADAIFVSTPAWVPLIHRLGRSRPSIDWTSVPSGVSLNATPKVAAQVREQFGRAGGDVVLGHFGTYREDFSRAALRQIVPRLVCDRERSMIFMGRGSERFAADLLASVPALTGRVHGTGALSAQELSNHLAACDLLIQPFEDGVTTRRTSVAGALCLGVPVATTSGTATEELWAATGAVALARADDTDAFVALIERLAADPVARGVLASAGRRLYRERFAIEHTIATIRRRAGALRERPSPDRVYGPSNSRFVRSRSAAYAGSLFPIESTKQPPTK